MDLGPEQVGLSGALPFPLGLLPKPGGPGQGSKSPSELKAALRSEQTSRYLTNPHWPRVALSAGPPKWGCPGLGTNWNIPDLPSPQQGRGGRTLVSTASSSSTRI